MMIIASNFVTIIGVVSFVAMFGSLLTLFSRTKRRGALRLLKFSTVVFVSTLISAYPIRQQAARQNGFASADEMDAATRKSAEEARLAYDKQQADIAARKAEELAAKSTAELAELKARAANASKLSNQDRYALFELLSQREPTNQEYKRKRDDAKVQWDAQMRQAAAAVRVAENIHTRPDDFLKLDRFSWRKGGFGSVMIMEITVRNVSPVTLKDFTVTCDDFSPSGTRIDTNTNTIYQSVKSGASRTIREVNMGFVHSQAHSTSCRISNAQIGS